ncbi:DUF4238 domain-containing protein [Planococcus faecalis]|uniref:DUF4238 domain-containing protein n=1 Tax=Planococcus faecalis TaxID=1598147 RepID=A0ABM6IP86_9BACL|nr:DUF4238 domain-containing protein [Planococcus faecalis]AQU78314.1 hypothetical protein AJGP001_02930 [Planococcus faecalis]OHX51300.1 hypothetical protein BB777_17310 [Planococcus faecalis]
MTQQAKKRQHYVPQFYLNSFASKRKKNFKITFYDKVSKSDVPVNVRDVAQENKFYNVTAQNFKETFGFEPPSDYNEQELEDTFSVYEGQWATVFREISERYEKEKISNKFQFPFISSSEKKSLSSFIALQAIRTPAFRDRANLLSGFLEKNLDNELAALFKDRQYDDAHFYIHILSGVLDRLSENFLDNFNWVCAFSEKPLITSDNPLAQIFHLKNRSQYNGKDWPEPPYFEEYSIALTPNILLILSHKNDEGFESLIPKSDFLLTDHLHIRYTRYHIINSSRKIFFFDKTELKYIKKRISYMIQNKENYLDNTKFIVSAP